MSEQTKPAAGMYGYTDDEVKRNPFNFGLNKKTYLTKFGYIMNGGKDGAEGEALDIVFTINGTEKGYRVFPFSHGFDKNNQPVTDPNAQEYKDALQDWNAKITHVLHLFLDKDTIKSALSREITSFKQYCEIITNLLPKDYSTKELFSFLVYQWQPSPNKDRTYLELPKTMKYGKWLCVAQAGNWKEVKVENPDDNEREAIKYVDEAGNTLPFTRNGWFMNSKFAHQQRDSAEEESTTETTASTSNVDAPKTAAPPKKPAAW